MNKLLVFRGSGVSIQTCSQNQYSNVSNITVEIECSNFEADFRADSIS